MLPVVIQRSVAFPAKMVPMTNVFFWLERNSPRFLSGSNVKVLYEKPGNSKFCKDLFPILKPLSSREQSRNMLNLPFQFVSNGSKCSDDHWDYSIPVIIRYGSGFLRHQ